MDPTPNSAIAMAIGLLIIIWIFFLHMIFSQASDARLQFFLDLLDVREGQSKSSSPLGASPCLPDDYGMETLPATGGSATNETRQHSAQYTRRQVPLLFTTSLRGRGL